MWVAGLTYGESSDIVYTLLYSVSHFWGFHGLLVFLKLKFLFRLVPQVLTLIDACSSAVNCLFVSRIHLVLGINRSIGSQGRINSTSTEMSTLKGTCIPRCLGTTMWAWVNFKNSKVTIFQCSNVPRLQRNCQKLHVPRWRLEVNA